MSANDQDNSKKRRADETEAESDDGDEAPTKRGCVRRTAPGGTADCGGRRVPDGFLYHVVGVDEKAGLNGPVRLLVRPGVPACWMHTNAGFFVGRHVAKILPDVPQYACATATSEKAAAAASRRRTIPVKCPTASSYVWPAYEVDFESAPVAFDAADDKCDVPLLSQLYTSLVRFAVDHMPDIAVFLKSGSVDVKMRAHLEKVGDSLLAPCFAAGRPDALSLELSDVKSPLLLTTHCLILDRDIVHNPGPASLVDSIPPVMRHDGMPDLATLERWVDLTRRRCQTTTDPVLAWGAASIQFGEGVYKRQKSLWDVAHQQVASAGAVNKGRGRSHHDAWVESVFRVASVPFTAFLLKRRNVTLPEQQLPLADMPVWSLAYERPLVALHPLAPKRVFNFAAVLASVMCHAELAATDRPQVPCARADDRATTACVCVQDRAICEKMLQVCSILTSAVFCNTAQLNKVCWRLLRACNAMQGVRYEQLIRLDIAGLSLHTTPASAFVAKMVAPNARWDRSVNSYAASFGVWSAELVAKHSRMPNAKEVLKRVAQFASDPNSLQAAVTHCGAPYLQDTIAKLVAPGVVAASGQPHRVCVLIGVALHQLCFAYNMAPPLELPTRMLQHAGDSSASLPATMPFTDPRRHFPLKLGHDALRPLAEPDVLGMPAQLVPFSRAPGDGDLEPHVVVVPGEVWAHPSHWSRVRDLMRKTAGTASRLCVLLGGHECPFGFVRCIAAYDETGSAQLNLPDDMDCGGAPISVPAGVWCPCPVEVSSAFNASAIYNLRPTDRVLVVNALQVLPCVLEYIVAAGRVSHCRLALGALPPKSIRLAPITKLTAILEARAAGSGGKTLEPSAQREARCEAAKGIPCHAPTTEKLGGTLFSRSAARLDCAGLTSRYTAVATTPTSTTTTYSHTFLHIAGLLGLNQQLADLLFLPRVVHACARHQCTVLLDPAIDQGTMKWIDSAHGSFQCVFTQVPGHAAFADQTLRGPTLQPPWMDCFDDDGAIMTHAQTE